MTDKKILPFEFRWAGGATFILSTGNLKIACDPVLCNKGSIQDYFWFTSERLEDPVYDETTFRDIDLWMITHAHEDHLDAPGISVIHPDTPVVCNQNASNILKGKGIHNLTVLPWHHRNTFSIKGYRIEIESIPAIHGVNPLSAWFAGRVNGYYITLSKDGERLGIYITGDTVYKRKVTYPLSGKNMDVMIANMGAAKEGSWIMTLTLNARMLRNMMDKLNPALVIPVHYGTFAHYKEPVENIKALKDERITILPVGGTLRVNSTGLIM